MARTARNVVCLLSLILAVTLTFADADHGSEATSYDKESFQSAITEKKHFVMFFAPWCGHCKRLAPTWDSLATLYNNEESAVTVAKVDCTLETALCADHDVTGYPTLKFFNKKGDDFQRYKGNRDLDSLQKFIQEQAAQPVADGKAPPPPVEDGQEEVVELNDESFEDAIQEGFTFVKFYAPWCGHCKRLAPTWEDLAQSFAGSPQVAVAKVDCTVASELCSSKQVKGYPTLILYKDGDFVEQYQGGRSHEDLKAFLTQKVKDFTAEIGGQQEVVPEGGEEAVLELTDDNFDEAISDGITFIKFFAPWCGHCKRLAPTWEELGLANLQRDVKIARVDCTQQQATCSSHSVKGYPTLIIFQNGVRLDDYKGQRTLEDLQKYVDGFAGHTEL